MSQGDTGRHHPLPSDPRARHDRLPESIENARERDEGEGEGENKGGPEPASPDEPPLGHYRDPDGRPYNA